MEEAHQGRDAATLEVVMEAARPLTRGQLEGLGHALGRRNLRQLSRAAYLRLQQLSHPRI